MRPLTTRLLFTLLLLFPIALLCQTRDLGSIQGHVQDTQAAAVRGAHVTARNILTGVTRSAATDDSGNYTFVGLALTGEYVVSVKAEQFSEVERTDVVLRAGVAARIDFTLNVSAAQSTVEVLGTASDVTTDSNQIADRLDLPQIENTPILGRKMSSLQLLDSSVRLAQTTGDVFLNETLVVVNGTGRRQTSYSLDNATADDSWGRQTLFTAVPFSAVQEFTILPNSPSAEYGRNAGAAVNIVTKAGTDQFHGELIGLGRPAFSQARLPFTPPTSARTSSTMAQGSGAVSGPIVKGRTWFLASAEYTNQDRDAVITSPVAPGIYSGTFGQTLLLGRIDHQLTAGNRLSLRVNSERFSDTNPQDAVSGVTLPSAGRVFRRNTYSAELSDTATISSRTLNQARAQFQLGDPITQFNPVQPGPQIFISGVYTSGESRVANLANHQYQFADTLSTVRGSHNLKAGFDVIRSSSGGYGQEFGSGFLLGRFQLNAGPASFPYASIPIATVVTLDPAAAPPGAPAGAPALVNTFTQSFGNASYNIKETLYALFLQDNWNVTRNITLSLGMRYEAQTFTGDTNNVAPRIGIAWVLPHTASTVLRAGYGIYYSEERADLAAGDLLGGPQGVFTYSAQPGQLGFPTSFAPLSAFPAGAALPARDITVRAGQCGYLNQFLDVTKLWFCPSALLNPYTQQWNLGIEHEIAKGWIVSADYLGSHTVKIERPVDLNAPASFARTAQGQTRTAAAANATRPITPVNNGYRRVVANANLGTAFYDGLQLRLRKNLSQHFSLLMSYTWSHTIDTVAWDAASQDPQDSLTPVAPEKATSILDQRHRAALSGTYELPWQLTMAAFAQLASGYPYNVTTGTDNNGDGSTSDRPLINGAVIPRNYGRGTPIYDTALSLEKSVRVNERLNVSFRAEAFNVFNHLNVYGRNGIYGNNATPPAAFGTPNTGIANIGYPRQLEFMMRLKF